MFSVSAKGVYGLTAMVELAGKWNLGSTQIRDLAKPHGIPQHYLEQILVTLKKAGLVESYRGAQGGYALAQDPGNITVLDVLSSLEGRLEIVPDNDCARSLDFFWQDISTTIGAQLQMTLEELVSERQKHTEQLSYSI